MSMSQYLQLPRDFMSTSCYNCSRLGSEYQFLSLLPLLSIVFQEQVKMH